MTNPVDLEFVYIGDPMCSWCWGFAPVLDGLDLRYDISLRTVVGGLRPGPNAEPLKPSTKATLLHHWEQVAAASGQPFDMSGLDRSNWTYDTELPARAVVTFREDSPGETLAFFTRLQRAFYAEAVDITDPHVYPPLVAEFSDDVDGFMSRLLHDESRTAAWTDFTTARNLGIAGFPSLLLRVGDEYLMVTRGYLPGETLEPALDSWLAKNYPDHAAQLIAG